MENPLLNSCRVWLRGRLSFRWCFWPKKYREVENCRLVLDWRWPWIFDLPTSTCLVLGTQLCFTTPSFIWGWWSNLGLCAFWESFLTNWAIRLDSPSGFCRLWNVILNCLLHLGGPVGPPFGRGGKVYIIWKYHINHLTYIVSWH